MIKDSENLSFFKKHYKKIGISPPDFHFVLGSGFSSHLDKIKAKNWEEREGFSFQAVKIPSPTVGSHAGLYRFFVHKKTGRAVSFQCGRLHLYEGHSPQVVAEPVLQVQQAGTQKFILSNISGSLKKERPPGTVLALTDHVNMTGLSPLRGPEKTDLRGKKVGPRFPDMSRVYDVDMRERISQELLACNLQVDPGVYVCLLGPELETSAQIEWLKFSSNSRFDVAGMSTVMEVIALKQAGARVAGFSLISNLATGVEPQVKDISFSDLIRNMEPFSFKILQAFFSYSESQF